MSYHGQYEMDKFLFENFPVLQRRKGIAVECGAFDGVIESTCLFFEEELNWHCINFEPCPPLFDRLKINRPKADNYNLALSNSEGIKTFSHVISPTTGELFGNGSLTLNLKHLHELLDSGCTLHTYQVNTIPYYKVCQIPDKIDLFVLDVEGHEKEALEGITPYGIYPKIFVIEYGLAKNFSHLMTNYVMLKEFHGNYIYKRKDLC